VLDRGQIESRRLVAEIDAQWGLAAPVAIGEHDNAAVKLDNPGGLRPVVVRVNVHHAVAIQHDELPVVQRERQVNGSPDLKRLTPTARRLVHEQIMPHGESPVIQVRSLSARAPRPLSVGRSDATAGPENLTRRCVRVGALAGGSCYIPADMAPIGSITVQVEVGGPQTAQLLVAQTGWALMSLPETEPGVATYSLYVGVANPDADVQAHHLEALDGALANGRWQGKRISNGVVMTGQTNPLAASGVLYRATSDEAAARARTVAPHDLEASDRVFLGTCTAFRQTNVFLTTVECLGSPPRTSTAPATRAL